MKPAIVGERNGRAVLSDSDVVEMRVRFMDGESYANIAREFSVTRGHARRIVMGLSRSVATPSRHRHPSTGEACTVDLMTRVPATLALEVSRHAGRLGVSRARVLRDALAAYLANEEPVPATPAPQPPALNPRGAPTPARAHSGRPMARACMPRVVPGGRRT